MKMVLLHCVRGSAIKVVSSVEQPIVLVVRHSYSKLLVIDMLSYEYGTCFVDGIVNDIWMLNAERSILRQKNEPASSIENK